MFKIHSSMLIFKVNFRTALYGLPIVLTVIPVFICFMDTKEHILKCQAGWVSGWGNPSTSTEKVASFTCNLCSKKLKNKKIMNPDFFPSGEIWISFKFLTIPNKRSSYKAVQHRRGWQGPQQKTLQSQALWAPNRYVREHIRCLEEALPYNQRAEDRLRALKKDHSGHSHPF